jgi:hypothetical protein
MVRSALRRVIVIALLAGSVSETAAYADQVHGEQITPSGPLSRVRSEHPVIRRQIIDGLTRSATFRRLVETIEQTDGVLYVQHGQCGHGVRTCLALSMTLAGRYRVLRLILDPQRQDDEALASLGHELQHAAEVLGDHNIRTSTQMYYYFRWIGHSGRVTEQTFETRAAIEAGNTILGELSKTDLRRNEVSHEGGYVLSLSQ